MKIIFTERIEQGRHKSAGIRGGLSVLDKVFRYTQQKKA